MKKNTKLAYPDWSNPQAIIVVADRNTPKKVGRQPFEFQSNDLCKLEIEFRTDCDYYCDFFNTKTAQEKHFLDQECGRQLAWNRAVEVAEMLWLKNVAAHREYERYAVYFRPAHKTGGIREAVCICSVLRSSIMGDAHEG